LEVIVVYNRVILIGRTTRDPELRYSPQGHPVTSFTLAVDRSFKNSQGEREADFIDVTLWRKPGELVAQYVNKGQLLAVEGRLEIRSYTDTQGIRRKGARIVANAVRFLTPKSASGAGDGQRGAAVDQAEGGEPEAETAVAGADAEADVDF
jgi:single-strand DNA-binding protein